MTISALRAACYLITATGVFLVASWLVAALMFGVLVLLWLRGKRRPVSPPLLFSAGDWWLQRDEQRVALKVLPSTWMSSWLVIVCAKEELGGQVRCWRFTRDSLTETDFRALCRSLRATAPSKSNPVPL